MVELVEADPEYARGVGTAGSKLAVGPNGALGLADRLFEEAARVNTLTSVARRRVDGIGAAWTGHALAVLGDDDGHGRALPQVDASASGDDGLTRGADERNDDVVQMRIESAEVTDAATFKEIVRAERAGLVDGDTERWLRRLQLHSHRDELDPWSEVRF